MVVAGRDSMSDMIFNVLECQVPRADQSTRLPAQSSLRKWVAGMISVPSSALRWHKIEFRIEELRSFAIILNETVRCCPGHILGIAAVDDLAMPAGAPGDKYNIVGEIILEADSRDGLPKEKKVLVNRLRMRFDARRADGDPPTDTIQKAVNKAYAAHNKAKKLSE